MSGPEWVPKEIDLTKPSEARVYDYYLGGSHNFAVDRDMAEKVLELAPSIRHAVQYNRAFVRRAVLFLVNQGINQFLDIGSGIPTVGNVHEIAQAANPETRVVYADHDAVAVTHSKYLLANNPLAAAIQADLREMPDLLVQAHATGLINPTKPVGIIMAAVLHYIPDLDELLEMLQDLYETLAPGSYVVISHSTTDGQVVTSQEIFRLYAQASHPLVSRNHAEVSKLLTGLNLAEPGVVFTVQWRPDSPQEPNVEPAKAGIYAAVGCKE